jgi:hypothetical protein
MGAARGLEFRDLSKPLISLEKDAVVRFAKMTMDDRQTRTARR